MKAWREFSRDKDHLHLATINKSETLPLSVGELQRGSSRRGRQDHQHISYFKRLQTALKIKWGPLGADSEKQELFQVQKNLGSLLNS